VRAFLGGFAAAIIVVVLLVFGAIETGAIPARADGGLLPGEKWAARTSLNATIEREAPKPPYPAYATDADLSDGARLYVQNCAVCHGTAHTGANAIARGLGVRPPQFAKHDVSDDPESETYWKIAHGIRFTGMPAFEHTMSERDMWQMAFFLKRLPDKLAPSAAAIWNDPSTVAAPTPMPAEPDADHMGMDD
jgi:mono/diheme cytochrome c family protein